MHQSVQTLWRSFMRKRKALTKMLRLVESMLSENIRHHGTI